MEIHQIAGRLLTVVPRNRVELRADTRAAVRALCDDPHLLWSGVGLLGAGLLFAMSRRRPATLLSGCALAGMGVVWLRVDHTHEGDILFRLSHQHGITEADLLVPLVFAASGTVWLIGQILVRRRRRRGRPSPLSRLRTLIPTGS